MIPVNAVYPLQGNPSQHIIQLVTRKSNPVFKAEKPRLAALYTVPYTIELPKQPAVWRF